MSQVKTVLLPLREVLLQHLHMGEERGIVEILRAQRASPDAGLAFDADARHICHILRIDRSHRTELHAVTALRALLHVRKRLRLQELRRLAVRSLRDVIGGGCITRDLQCFTRLREFFRAGCRLQDKGLRGFQIRIVRAARGKKIRECVTAREGSASCHEEAIRLQDRHQLRQRIVKASVSVGDHCHCPGAVPLQLRLEVRKDLVRQLSRVGRRSYDDQIARLELRHSLPCRRDREIKLSQRTSDRFRRRFSHCSHDLFRISGSTPVNSTDSCNIHVYSSRSYY